MDAMHFFNEKRYKIIEVHIGTTFSWIHWYCFQLNIHYKERIQFNATPTENEYIFSKGSLPAASAPIGFSGLEHESV
jgi:hypothetical protein